MPTRQQIHRVPAYNPNAPWQDAGPPGSGGSGVHGALMNALGATGAAAMGAEPGGEGPPTRVILPPNPPPLRGILDPPTPSRPPGIGWNTDPAAIDPTRALRHETLNGVRTGNQFLSPGDPIPPISGIGKLIGTLGKIGAIASIPGIAMDRDPLGIDPKSIDPTSTADHFNNPIIYRSGLGYTPPATEDAIYQMRRDADSPIGTAFPQPSGTFDPSIVDPRHRYVSPLLAAIGLAGGGPGMPNPNTPGGQNLNIAPPIFNPLGPGGLGQLG